MDAKKTEQKVKKLQQIYFDQIEVIAEEVRKKVIIPLCKKYNLEFVSGMGMYSFSGVWLEDDLRFTITSPSEAMHYNLPAVADAFELLDIAVIEGVHNIGDYVFDVRNGK